MSDSKEPSPPLRVGLRIPKESNDPRYVAFWEWYSRLPNTPTGRKAALQERIMDLIGAALGVNGPHHMQQPSQAASPPPKNSASQKPGRKRSRQAKSGKQKPKKAPPKQLDKPSGAAVAALQQFDF